MQGYCAPLPVGNSVPASLWFKHAPGTADNPALAELIGGPFARHIATATIVRLRELALDRRDIRDGHVARLPSARLAALVDWPGNPETFTADLESAGVTRHGTLAGWLEAFPLAISPKTLASATTAPSGPTFAPSPIAMRSPGPRAWTPITPPVTRDVTVPVTIPG